MTAPPMARPHPLALEFVELRAPAEALPSQLLRYTQLQRMSRAIQRYLFSGALITPGVMIGLGCIIALHQSSSTLYQIHEHIRCLYFCTSNVAEPQVTTTEDANFAACELAERLGLQCTSSPAVRIYRSGVGWLGHGPAFSGFAAGLPVLAEGDMVVSDWGLRGYGGALWTDNTMLGYVGAAPPAELRAGLAKANRVQAFYPPRDSDPQELFLGPKKYLVL